MTTFFGKCEPKFLPVPDDKKIEAAPFIAAAKNIPPFFDCVGTAFKPVKSDIEGNVVKLEKVHAKNPEKYTTLNAMIEDDIANNNTKHKDSATVALLWLTRGLEYIMVFLKELIKDKKKEGGPDENIQKFVAHAYKTTLETYHGWIVKKVFSVVSHAAPYRRVLIKAVALDDESQEEQAYADMEELTVMLEAHVAVIKEMYKELNVESCEKA